MDGPVTITVERTPNPNALKFTANRQLSAAGARTVASKDEAFGLPLAAALLDVPGVRSLFFLRDFVTVTRVPEADWETITPAVTDTIMAFLAA